MAYILDAFQNVSPYSKTLERTLQHTVHKRFLMCMQKKKPTICAAWSHTSSCPPHVAVSAMSVQY